MTAALLALAALTGADSPEVPPQLAALQACAAIKEDAGRLACYDRAMAALDQAVAAKSVLVVDRAKLKRDRERQFGLPRREAPVYSDAKVAEPARLEAVLASVAPAGEFLLLSVVGGGTWQTTEAAFAPPRPGAKLLIEKGALGGYFITYAGRSVRARRVK